VSTHIVEIVQIKELLPHHNADLLLITKINGWQCIVKKDQFNVGDKAIYIEPDYEVPLAHPLFEFLKTASNEHRTHERIKVRKFRKEISQGLLVQVPDNLKHLTVGTNVIEELGIRRYEPPEHISFEPKQFKRGKSSAGPAGLVIAKYDIESLQRHNKIFEPGETVICCEKAHGSNSRFVLGKTKWGKWKQFYGSRTRWIDDFKPTTWTRLISKLIGLFSKRKQIQFNRNYNIGGYLCSSTWIEVTRQNPAILEWCKANPNKVLFGELLGVQDLMYGYAPGQYGFMAFDILDNGRWFDYDEFCKSVDVIPGLMRAPEIYRGPFDFEKILQISDNLDSCWPGANHIAEGLVIRPEKERHDPRFGRVILKAVSNRYLERA
jgi:RNA ligase (TIGR02306 family)